MSQEQRRVRLRAVALDDVEPLYRMWSHPDVAEFLPAGGITREEIQELVRESGRDHHDAELGHYAIEILPSGSLIGICGFLQLDLDGQPELELIYMIGRHWWGKGLASEAVSLCLSRVSQRVGVDRIVVVVPDGHSSSVRLIMKYGFLYDRRIRIGDQEFSLYARLALVE